MSSSIGRASVSKTEGCRFESCLTCHLFRVFSLSFPYVPRVSLLLMGAKYRQTERWSFSLIFPCFRAFTSNKQLQESVRFLRLMMRRDRGEAGTSRISSRLGNPPDAREAEKPFKAVYSAPASAFRQMAPFAQRLAQSLGSLPPVIG